MRASVSYQIALRIIAVGAVGELLFEGRQEPPSVFQASKPIHGTVAEETRRTLDNLKEIF